jgi:hypothetical protein
MRLAIALVALLLAGCVSQEEIARRQALQAEYQQQAAHAYRDNLFRECRSIGYQEGTEGFKQCVLQLHMQNQAHNSQIESTLLQGAMQQQQQQNYLSLPYCSQLAPGLAGMARAQGRCR